MQFDRGYSRLFVTNAEKMLCELEKRTSSVREEAVRSSGDPAVLEAGGEERQSALDRRGDIEGEALATLVVKQVARGLKVALKPRLWRSRKSMLEDLAVITGGRS